MAANKSANAVGYDINNLNLQFVPSTIDRLIAIHTRQVSNWNEMAHLFGYSINQIPFFNPYQAFHPLLSEKILIECCTIQNSSKQRLSLN